MAGVILSHLSGSTRKGDTHLAFHWAVPSDDDIRHPTSDDDPDSDSDYDTVNDSTDSRADPVPQAVETTNPNTYINPDYLHDRTEDYIDPDELDPTSDYINPDDL